MVFIRGKLNFSRALKRREPLVTADVMLTFANHVPSVGGSASSKGRGLGRVLGFPLCPKSLENCEQMMSYRPPAPVASAHLASGQHNPRQALPPGLQSRIQPWHDVWIQCEKDSVLGCFQILIVPFRGITQSVPRSGGHGSPRGGDGGRTPAHCRPHV